MSTTRAAAMRIGLFMAAYFASLESGGQPRRPAECRIDGKSAAPARSAPRPVKPLHESLRVLRHRYVVEHHVRPVAAMLRDPIELIVGIGVVEAADAMQPQIAEARRERRPHERIDDMSQIELRA